MKTKLSSNLLHGVRSLSTSKYARSVCWPQPLYGPLEIQRYEMMNGMRIVAAKVSGALMAACTIMFQAGSRYETRDDLGATHFIRAASTTSGCSYSAFSKLRVLQQKGAYLTCTSDRQTVAFTLRCPVPLFSELKHYLVDAALRCCYHEWEVDDCKKLVKGDLARMSPEQRVLDLVQKAYWAGPLTNSVFCEEERIDSFSSETLRSYAQSFFKANRCGVASIGVPFEETIKLAEAIDSKTEKPLLDACEMPSRPRCGIEWYDLGADSNTWIAAALPGCASHHIHTLLKYAILASACGSENMAQGQHNIDRTPQGPSGMMSAGDIFTDFKAFNISYSNCGIFGIVVKTKAATACHCAAAACDFLANVGNLQWSQIEDGKKRLQVSLAIHDEDCVKASEGLALQALNNVALDSAQNAIRMINEISAAEVASIAKSFSSQRNQMAVAIVGDVAAVPTHTLKYV